MSILTTQKSVVIIYNMPATQLLKQRQLISESAFAELVVWQVSSPVRGSQHDYKYRLALVVDGRCVLRFDNEADKGDHYHIGEAEFPYRFSNVGQLLSDFWRQVDDYLDH